MGAIIIDTIPAQRKLREAPDLTPTRSERRMNRLVPKITEKRCKTALTKSGMRYTYAINPYTGCLHACVYGYCTFMRRFSGHMEDAWGSFVDVKVNLIEVLGKELPRRDGGSVWISSVCDPYQQLEAKYKLTRGALQLLSQHPQFTISILTKNALVLRDLEVLQQMKDRVEVGFTITTFDSDAQRIFEPHASTVAQRINAVKQLSAAGIRTWVFVAPMLPFATEVQLEEGLRRLAAEGVKHLETDRFNARASVINPTLEAYKTWNPSLDLEEIRELLWRGDEYYHTLETKISNLWRSMTPDATYARDLDYEKLRQEKQVEKESK